MGKFNIDFLKKHLKPYDNYLLLETGTFEGDTIQKLLPINFFKEYHSIEIDKKRYNHCVNKFLNKENVHLYLGDSAELIDNIINKNNDEQFICWLDAHHMGDSSTKGNGDCPLLSELDQLKKLKNPPIILIDDMFYMLNRDDPRYEKPKNPSHWPTQDQLEKKLKELDPNYELIYSLIYRKEDYLIAVPQKFLN